MNRKFPFLLTLFLGIFLFVSGQDASHSPESVKKKDSLQQNHQLESQKDSSKLLGSVINTQLGATGKVLGLTSGIINFNILPDSIKKSFVEAWLENKISHNGEAFYFNSNRIRDYGKYIAQNRLSKTLTLNHGTERPTRPSWIIWLIMLIIGIISFIKVKFPTDLKSLNESLFKDRLLRDDREIGFLKSPSAILILLAFCMSTALLVYFYFRDQKIDLSFSDLNLIGVLSAGILIFYSFKIILLWIIGIIFKVNKVVQNYLSLNYIVMANFTLVVTPFLILYALDRSFFIPYLLVWIPFLIILFFVFLFVRSAIFVLINYRFSYFYLFLYFCSIEICPILIVFKVIYA